MTRHTQILENKVFYQHGDNKPYSEQNGLSMVKLLDQSRWMVGVFVTLYMTLLDFSNISLNDNSNTTVTSSVGGITEFVMRAVIGILLLLPLVALSVTLIMRIGILRWLIAFAPLWVAAFALFDMKWWGEWLLKNINLKSILWIIFAPIVPVFVLSISIIFIQALHRNMNDDLGKEQNAWSFMGMQFTKQAEKNTTCADFWWLQQLCYKTNDDLPGGSVFANLFPRLFVNIFSIAIMRFLVKMSFAASPLTAWAAEWIMNIGWKLLWSIPLIPIPGLGRQWINTVAKLPSAISNVWNNIWDYYNRKSDAAIDRMWDTIQEAMGIKEKTATPASTISSYTPPAKVTNFNKWSELTNHLGLNNGGTLNTTNATTEKIEKLVNNDGKEKIITWSTTSEKSDQIIGILNDMFEGSSIIDQQKQLTYKSIFNEWLSPYISDKTSWTIKEESKNAITWFLNSPNIQKMLNLDTNDKISEWILKKINYKDKDNKTFKLEKGTGTTYTRTSS
jgi:hypothetical protein